MPPSRSGRDKFRVALHRRRDVLAVSPQPCNFDLVLDLFEFLVARD
jgi:hypothetical protein